MVMGLNKIARPQSASVILCTTFPSVAHCVKESVNCVADPALTPELVGYVILAFFVVELVDGDLLSFRHRLHCLAELLRHLSEHDG